MRADRSDEHVVRVDRLTKHFGAVRAVEDLSFTVRPGRVTGFLGPNGAGKTTTLRMLLGLVRPTAGTSTIGGRRYAEIERPGKVVGAAIEASGFHPGRTARDHLRVLAPQVDADERRVTEALGLVGLTEAAGRRVGGFSLGMRQRLSLAGTLLGDPPVLLLDEPANGLDPEGIVWLRAFLRHLAAEGRTVLVSSHVLGEIQQSADDIVIISKGALVLESPLSELTERAGPVVAVRSPAARSLEDLVAAHGWRRAGTPRGPAPSSSGEARTREESEDGVVLLEGVTMQEVGEAAFAAGIELHELSRREAGLERTFLDLTREAANDGRAGVPGTSTAADEAAATRERGR